MFDKSTQVIYTKELYISYVIKIIYDEKKHYFKFEFGNKF